MKHISLRASKPLISCALATSMAMEGLVVEVYEPARAHITFETIKSATVEELYPPIKAIPDDIASINLTNPQYYEWISAEAFEAALPSSMKPYAKFYHEEGLAHNINFIFMAAKDSLESGYFTSDIFAQTNNAGGWTMRNGEFREFDSPQHYIEYSFDAIGNMYLTPDAPYFNGYSINDINVTYNGKQEWVNTVSSIYENYLIKILNYQGE